MKFHDHVLDRSKDVPINIHMDYATETVVFPLWNLSGQLVGILQYKWGATKGDYGSDSRYRLYMERRRIGVYGLDKYTTEGDLYITEGVWDCIAVQATGRRCIAVLSNNPKHLTSWLRSLPNKIIAVCDGDKSGKLLAKHADKGIHMPKGLDAGDLTTETLNNYLLNA